MSNLKCLNCGSGNLVFYREELHVFKTPLTKGDRIPKKENLLYTDGNFPHHVDCDDCKSMFDYETNKEGKVIRISEL